MRSCQDFVAGSNPVIVSQGLWIYLRLVDRKRILPDWVQRKRTIRLSHSTCQLLSNDTDLASWKIRIAGLLRLTANEVERTTSLTGSNPVSSAVKESKQR